MFEIDATCVRNEWYLCKLAPPQEIKYSLITFNDHNDRKEKTNNFKKFSSRMIIFID